MKFLLIFLLLTYLIICTISDIKYKKISLIQWLIFLVLGIILQLFIEKNEILFLLFSSLPGLLLILLSVISPGHIGIGDGMMIAICGIYTDFTGSVSIIFLSCTSAVIFYILKKVFLKINIPKSYPLAPFLLFSFCIISFLYIL